MWRSNGFGRCRHDHDDHRDKPTTNEPAPRVISPTSPAIKAVDEHLARHRTGDTGFAGNQVDADTVRPAN